MVRLFFVRVLDPLSRAIRGNGECLAEFFHLGIRSINNFGSMSNNFSTSVCNTLLVYITLRKMRTSGKPWACAYHAHGGTSAKPLQLAPDLKMKVWAEPHFSFSVRKRTSIRAGMKLHPSLGMWSLRVEGITLTTTPTLGGRVSGRE